MARSVSETIDSLPHWARVAFAARCSRIGLPLFERFWSEAAPRRLEAVCSAIQLAERSAAQALMSENLSETIASAIVTACAALGPVYGMNPSGEPTPSGDLGCQIASFVAKSAEWAARAAQAEESGSGSAALEVYTWTRDAARLAEAVDMLARMEDDLAGLCRVATRGRWTDHTPVPAGVFDLLTGQSSKPWWTFRK